MVRYIKSDTEFSDIANKLNVLIENNESSSISKIISILDNLPAETRLYVADGEKRTTYFDKTSDGWEDNPYTYSSYDIADELLHGKFNYVYRVAYSPVPNPKTYSKRNAPKMWR